MSELSEWNQIERRKERIDCEWAACSGGVSDLWNGINWNEMKLMEWSKEWTAAEGANDKPSRQTRRGKPLSLHLSFAPPRKAGQKEREKRRERDGWPNAATMKNWIVGGYGPEAISAEEQASNFIIHSLAFLPSLVKLSLLKRRQALRHMKDKGGMK